MLRSTLKSLKNIPLVNKVLRNSVKRASRMVNKLSVISKVSGVHNLTIADKTIKWYAKGDDGVADGIYYDRFEESVDILLFQYLSKFSKTILDVGANTGIYAVVSGLENPSAHVVAFEPFITNYDRLVQNCELNDLSNVKNEMIALGSTNTTLDFYVPSTDVISTVTSVNAAYTKRKSLEHTREGTSIELKKIEVPQTTLDDYMKSNSLDSLELIKVDVETHEMEVFKGAIETLEKYSPVILTEIFMDEERKAYFTSYFKELGYTCYLLLHSGLVRVEGELIPNWDTMNYLFSKKKTTDVYISFNRGLDFIKSEIF